MATTKYFQCEHCGVFTPISDKKNASKYCGRSCRGKAYYQRKKLGLASRYHYHGLSDHPLYGRWEEMKRRCYNKSYHRYADYGGRGIKVCDRWLDASKYIEDVLALGPQPSPKHTIDRIDNDGDYEPGNIHWASQTEQNFNQRLRRDNTSGHRGVYYDKTRQRWLVRLQIEGSEKFIGRFHTLDEAAAAYEAAFAESAYA